MDEREGIIKHLKKFFAERASFYGVEMVFLFGSWATGIPRQDSDLDIAVVFRDELYGFRG
jgi:predicted nucleotidyltransferase